MLIVISFHLFAVMYLGLLLLYIIIKANRKINVASYVVGLYFLSVVGGVFLDPSLTPSPNDYSLLATLLFLTLLTFFFIPIIISETHKIDVVQCSDYKLFDIISYGFILVGIASYFYFIPIIYEMLTYITDLKNFRGVDTGFEGKVLYLVLTLGCQFFPIVLLFYFHSVCYRPHKVWFNRLLLLSSTAYIINVLTVMGRDGFVLWTMSYVFAFLLYKKLLPKKNLIKIKKTLIIFLCLFSTVFFAISISRFYVDGSIYWLVQKLLVYFSQQFGEFNRFVTVVDNPTVDVGSIFPILDSVGSTEKRDSFISQHYSFLSEYGFSKNVFKTFVGHFYDSLGMLITIFISCLFLLLFSVSSLLGSRTNVDFGKLIMITMFSQIVLHGVFYYKLAYMVSNIYMISCVILSFIFSYSFTKKNN